MGPAERPGAGALVALGVAVAVAALGVASAGALGEGKHAPGLAAFPGAEGFGAQTPGGRGGTVLRVTNTRDSGPGSLRAALEAQGPRIVVFRTGGLIRLRSAIEIRDPFVTVAGQSAPGDGIAIKGAPIVVRTHDVVLRYLRVRPGDGPGEPATTRDGITVDDTPRNEAHDVVVDHCSLSWAVDENADAWNAPRDVTYQWTIFSEGLRRSIHAEGVHSMGILVGAGTRRITLHHDLFAHNNGRNPVLQTHVHAEVLNNVMYDWGYTATELYPLGLHADIAGNTYLRGPDSSHKRKGIAIWGGPARGARIWLDDNAAPGHAHGTGSEWDAVSYYDLPLHRLRAAGPALEPSGVAVQARAEAYDDVLASAGATLPARDPVDARVVASVVNRDGHQIDSPAEVGGYPAYAEGTAPPDADADGMPDAFETAEGLAPLDPSDGPQDGDGDGYTNVEEFLNGTQP